MDHHYCVTCDPGGYVLRHRQAAAGRFERELGWLTGRSRAATRGSTGAVLRTAPASMPTA